MQDDKLRRMQDAEVKGKRVVLRLDLNVPVQDGQVSDFARIDRAKPTIDALRAAGASIRILSHFGRPKGVDAAFSLEFLVPVLADRWGAPVAFATSFDSIPDAPIVLIENVRFDAGEEKDDEALATRMAALGDVYVNDAFSVSHRAHASVHAITKHLPSYAGLAMQAELDALHAALTSPARPVVAIVGGSKISTKIDLLQNLVKKVDVLVLGGGMANTFLLLNDWNPQGSLCERDMLDTARAITAAAAQSGCEIVLPTDFIGAAKFDAHADHRVVVANDLPEGWLALDLGPASVTRIAEKLHTAKTVVWNGPLGAFEMAPFAGATVAVAQHVAELTDMGKLTSVAGGGDTLSALAVAGVTHRMTYVSAAGGAFLEWLEGRELPGVEALRA